MSAEKFLEQFGYLFYVVSPNRTSFESPEQVPDYIVQVIPHFILIFVLEQCALLYQKKPIFRSSDNCVSVGQGILNELFRVGARGAQFAAYTYVHNNWKLIALPWNSPWTWWLCFLGVDFSYYWVHRALHEINILWAAHQVHHSSEDYNITTSLRLSIFQDFSVWMFYLPLALAIPTSILMVHVQLNLLSQFWLHTEVIKSMGPLEYILNTPSHHRVHHGRNRYCIDKNYGAIFIIWDRIFGTFQAEKEEVVYGVTQPINSFNPFYIQLCHYMHIWRTFWRVKGVGNKLSVIFKGPGWSPGSPWHGYPEDIPDVKAPVKKFDLPLPMWFESYAVFHLFVLILGYVEIFENSQKMPNSVFWGSLAYELFSHLVLGMLFERRLCAPWLEIVRCLLYFAVDYFLLPFTRLSTLASSVIRWRVILCLRTVYVCSFLFWLQHCLRNVTFEMHFNKTPKKE